MKHRIEIWKTGEKTSKMVQREFFNAKECDRNEHIAHYNTLASRYNNDCSVTIVRGDTPDILTAFPNAKPFMEVE